MEIRTSETAKTDILSYAVRYLRLQLDKKKIDQDVKALKQEFKEEGIAVGVVQKAINVAKANKKRTDAERFELETITEYIEENPEAQDLLTELAEA